MAKITQVTTTRGRQPIFTAPGRSTGLGPSAQPTAYGQPATLSGNTRQITRPVATRSA